MRIQRRRSALSKTKARLMFIFVVAALICLILIIPPIVESINSHFNSWGVSREVDSDLIVIDPGHGGIDGGTSKGSVLEKDVNLAISMKLKKALEEKGYRVMMTREKDISLEKLFESSAKRHIRDLNARVKIINESMGGLFLSIHANFDTSSTSTNGSIVFYGDRYSESKLLAGYIQDTLNNLKIGEKSRNTSRPRNVEYFVLKNSRIPGVLIETGFISNAAERAALTDEEFQQGIADVVVQGVEEYYGDLAE